MMHIVFVGYHDFSVQSAAHIFHLANALVRLGHQCTVFATHNKESVHQLGEPLFTVRNYDEKDSFSLPPGESALVHAWTPREGVRRCTQYLRERLRCPYLVHLEDNELAIMKEYLGLNLAEADAMTDAAIAARLPEDTAISCVHPRRFRPFLAGASGITLIVESLADFVPAGVPHMVITPSCNVPSARDAETGSNVRRELGIAADVFVVYYPGAVNKLNRSEIVELYEAVGTLYAEGANILLLRTGIDYCPLPHGLANAPHVLNLGFRSWEEMARFPAAADFFVQPGGSNPYNDYRFPSKLPEFFAAGKAVLLPATNLGKKIRHGVDAWVLEQGDAKEIASTLRLLMQNPKLRSSLGQGARAFFERTFNWDNSARELSEFYCAITTKA
ncbi:glycosyltransferase family 4 protein [Desulfovibrio sp. OttesenSCG-928-F20]|nr:glycosyltransferase family 4 protein [Desulfovibrio sp. OttesenSCG-928-F20]